MILQLYSVRPSAEHLHCWLQTFEQTDDDSSSSYSTSSWGCFF